MTQGSRPIGPLGALGVRGREPEPGPRVVVVGAGLIGAATAEALTRRNARVTVVDRGQAGALTTTHGMGVVNASAKVKVANPQYLELSVAAMAAHDRIARDLAPPGWLHRSGHLLWVRQDQAAELLARVEALGEYGYPAGQITAAEARALEPALRAGPDDVVVLLPGELWVDGVRLVRRLLQTAGGRGAEVREDTTVTTLTRDGDGRVTGVELAGGERITADAVVNAAGPDAEHLARAAGSPLTLRPAPALTVYLAMGGRRVPLSRPVHTPTVRLRPHGPDHLWIGSDATDNAMLAPDFDVSAGTMRLLSAAREMIDLPDEATGVRAGVRSATAMRPMPVDELPSVGGLTATPGYYEAVTHSGATLAPLVGELLAEEIVTGEAAAVLDPFRPDRPQVARSSSPRPA